MFLSQLIISIKTNFETLNRSIFRLHPPLDPSNKFIQTMSRPRHIWSTRSKHLERRRLRRIIEIYSGTRENKKKERRKEARRCKSGRRALAACQTDVATSPRGSNSRVRSCYSNRTWRLELESAIFGHVPVHRLCFGHVSTEGKIFKFRPGFGERKWRFCVWPALIYFHDASPDYN